MASKKPAAKPAKKTKQKITAKLLPKTRSPKKMAARKSKPSKAKRYAGRGEKREAWAKKNPGMIPGELGKPARPDKMADSDAVAKAALEREAEKQGVTPDALLEKATAQAKELGLIDVKVSDAHIATDGAAVKFTAVDVTSQIGDRLDTSRDHLTGDQLDTGTGTYVAPKEDK